MNRILILAAPAFAAIGTACGGTTKSGTAEGLPAAPATTVVQQAPVTTVVAPATVTVERAATTVDGFSAFTVVWFT